MPALWDMLRDIRYAFRLFSRTPALTAVALLSIAISVGATAVVFTAVKSVLIQPLPYSHPEELVQIRTEWRFGFSRQDWVSWNDMQDVSKSTRTLESLGTYRYALFNLAGDGNSLPEALYGLAVSATLFPALGVKPMLGRNILPEEDQPGRDREMILSYSLWKRRFNSDRSVIGRSVQINGHDCVIIGVMPPKFDFPMRLATTVRTPSPHMDFWAPLGVDPAKADRNSTGFGAIGRLRKGVTPAQAAQDLAAIGARLAREYPRVNDATLHLAPLRDRALGSARTGLFLLMGAAVMFMLIGCANVANLLLARALARHREIAVRLALGATRKRIVGQLVIESCVLGFAGGIGAYVLTMLAWTMLPAIAPMSIPRLATARADWSVLAFTLGISVVNGILFGLAPAFRSAGRDPAIALEESGVRGSVGGRRNGLRSALVAAEVAVAVVLVVVGGLLTGSFVRLLRTDPGFEAGRVLASIIVPSDDRYQTPESRRVLFRRILDSIHMLPGVEFAGTVNNLPFSGNYHGGNIAGDSGEIQRSVGQVAEIDYVSADYLQTMGVRLLDGRWFRDDDEMNSRDFAIVNEPAAARLWPHQSAVGKRICADCAVDKPQHWSQVIGVVSSIHHAALDEPGGLEVYLSSGALGSGQFLVVRSDRPAGELARAIRASVAAIDPHQPVFLSAAMSSLIADSVADRRFIMTLLAIMGVLALLLSAAGVYGVASYAASQRTREIGVRMALGATTRHIYAMVLWEGMLMAAVGVVVGLASALALARVLRNVLPGLASADPLVIAIAVGVVAVPACVACLIPARRATHIDPGSALRHE